jgi:rhamnose utilization protein RhaD (predicted bifunctional aldolase and dehydrogenase)
MHKKNKLFSQLWFLALVLMMGPKANAHICEEMVVSYQSRVDSLKKDLKAYQEKVPQQSIEAINQLILNVEAGIASVGKISEQGLACRDLYSQVTIQINQINSKISRLADMDIVPLEISVLEDASSGDQAALRPVSSQPLK